MQLLTNCTNTKEHEKEEKEDKSKMEEFYQHLMKHSQGQAWRKLYTGSDVEIYGQYLMFEGRELDEDELLDEDLMLFCTDARAFNAIQSVPEMHHASVFRIRSRGLHPGYVKLQREEDHSELKLSDITVDTFGARHGPADTFSTADHAQRFVQSEPRISMETWMASRRNIITMGDNVFAIHSPHWPLEASDWISRPRMNRCPTKSTIEKVVEYGCDFVQVSHKLSKDDNEWRFSFSLAELTIIHSWTTSQRVVYRTLHMLCKITKSETEGTTLCTYYFKTLILWAVEEKPDEFWSEDVILESICQLLCEFKNMLETKICRNYFIPCNNMMDHLADSDLSPDIDALSELSQDKEFIEDVLYESRRVETIFDNITYNMKAPNWLFTSIVIFDQIYYSLDKWTLLFSKKFPTLLQMAISSQFSDLYYGLKFFQRAKNHVSHLTADDVSKSIKHWEISRESCDKKIFIAQCCSASIARRMLATWFLEYDRDADELHIPRSKEALNTDRIFNDGSKETYQKFLLYYRSLDNVERTCLTCCRSPNEFDTFERIDLRNVSTCSGNEIRITLRTVTTVDDEPSVGEYFYKEYEMSPTVDISWFLSNAYLANLYYTIQHNCAAAQEICNNLITIFKHSWCNEQFAEASIPVMLSTEWTSVYDEELQAILGLNSLFSFIFNRFDRSRSVCLGVCPVLFALYLKCRCTAKQMQSDQWNTICDEYYEHLGECRSDKKVCSGRWAMDATIEIVEESWKLFRKFSASTSLNRDNLKRHFDC